MRELVRADVPITRTPMSVGEAMELFRQRGELRAGAPDGAPREGDGRPPHAVRPAGVLPGLHGALHRAAGALRAARLPAGLPAAVSAPEPADRDVAGFTPYPKLFAVFEEAGHLLDRLGVRSAGALNDAVGVGAAGRGVAGRRGAARGAHRPDCGRHRAAGDRIKLVLIAGPSSSGKTTFSKRLAVQLLANGRRPFPVGLDDYFVDRDTTPRDERAVRLRVPAGGGRAPVQRAPAAA